MFKTPLALVIQTYRGAHPSRWSVDTELAGGCYELRKNTYERRKTNAYYYDYSVRCSMALFMKHKQRSTYKGLILYSEDNTHKNAMEIIRKNYNYAYILHDKDKDTNGELKKPHYHYIVKMPSCVPNSTLANALDIKENYIQCILSLQGAYDYLTHRHTPEKYQYKDSDIVSTIDMEWEKEKIIKGEFQCIMQSIKENKIKTMYELTEWCIQNDCLQALQKNAYLFSQILKLNL